MKSIKYAQIHEFIEICINDNKKGWPSSMNDRKSIHYLENITNKKNTKS